MDLGKWKGYSFHNCNVQKLDFFVKYFQSWQLLKFIGFKTRYLYDIFRNSKNKNFLSLNRYAFVNFHNLYSIELDLFDETYDSGIEIIYLINSDLRFTIDGKSVKTCVDISSARNGTAFNISSLFQIPLVKIKGFYLFGCRFKH